MGLLNTVIKKPDNTSTSVDVAQGQTQGDEKKILQSIDARFEELKMQNMENAKFLRGISRKIENEFYQIRELEESRSAGGYDDSDIYESVDRIEQSVSELNQAFNEKMGSYGHSEDMLDEIAKGNEEVLGEISRGNEEMIGEISRGQEEMLGEISKGQEEVLGEISRGNEEVLGEISRGQEEVLDEISRGNKMLENFDMGSILYEMRNVQAAVNELDQRDVMEELAGMKNTMEEMKKNNAISFNAINQAVHQKQTADNEELMEEIKALLKDNEEKTEELSKKLDRVSAMPSMVKNILEKLNPENLSKIEEMITEVNRSEKVKTDSIKQMLNVNLWVSLLTLAIVIARMLGIM